MKDLGAPKPRRPAHTSPWRFDIIAVVAAVIAWFALFILYEANSLDESILFFATLFVGATVTLVSAKPGSLNSPYFFGNSELQPWGIDEWAWPLIDTPKHDPIEPRGVSRTERWLKGRGQSNTKGRPQTSSTLSHRKTVTTERATAVKIPPK